MEEINKYPEVNFSIDNGEMKSSLKFAKQREERGWDETECWNLDVTIAKFILPRLKTFKRIHHGYPSELGEGQWEEALNKMIFAFEESITYDEWEFKLTPKELSEKQKKIEEGLSLFAKHFRDLWD